MDLIKRLGIEKPIIQAPMAGVQNWQLAAAVSSSGGLGSIPCGMLTQDQILGEITEFKAHCQRPFNLNFFCHRMTEPDEKALQAWQHRLAPFYTELAAVPPTEISGLRMPFDNKTAQILEAIKPPIISFHFGLPEPALVTQLRSWGTVIISTATTIDEGIWLEQQGADAVIAQGIEAGGHRGMFLTSDLSSQLTTTELVGGLVDRLSLPIIAAGGIADRHDVNAMLALGASAVQVGTSYLLCDEAKTSQVHRQALMDPNAKTAITNVYSGRAARGISNRLMQELGFMSELAPAFPYAAVAIAPLRTQAERQHLAEFSPLWAGTERSGCQAISAKAMTDKLWGLRE